MPASNLPDAARLLEFTRTLLETTGATLDPAAQLAFTRNLDEARAHLPEATFRAASHEGKTLTLRQVIDES